MTTATVIPIRREFQVHRFDAIKHGVLSKHIALPWEDRGEFEDILRGLLVEHAPQGPTAYHLVEDLAGVIWRKRRLLQAEGAAIRKRFYKVTQEYDHDKVGRYALSHTTGSTKSHLIDIIANRLPSANELRLELTKIRSAEAFLSANQSGAYQNALNAISAELRDYWKAEAVADGDAEPGDYTRNPERLSLFLRETREWYEAQLTDTASAPIVRDQAQAMAVEMRDMESIAKFEAHLDRKMQGLLAELRRLPKAKFGKL